MDSLRLPDGRRMAWREYGDPAGAPLLYCHGTPGTGAEFGWFLDGAGAARRRGLRVIAPDRPGMGGSTPHPGRTIAEWPVDAAALLDHLGVGPVAVLGYSGGTPYAAAVAARRPDRVRALGMAACAAHLAPGLEHGLDPDGLRLKRIVRSRPLTGRLLLYAALAIPARRAPARLLARAGRALPAVDRAVLASEPARTGFPQLVREAFRAGARGPALDMALMTGPWGVDLAAITAPAHLWQGSADTFGARPAMAEHVHRLIPDSTLHLTADGHLSVLTDHLDEILTVLSPDPSRARPGGD